MLFNAWLLPEKKGKVPAVTHNDGSARIQTVTEELNKPIFQLFRIKAKLFEVKTGKFC